MAIQLIGVLEDNAAISEFLEAGLKLAGYQVRAFDSPIWFMTYVGLDDPRPYDLIICDIMLPGSMTGVDVVKKLRESKPALPAILISGMEWRELNIIQQSLLDVPVLQKPFKFKSLTEQIAALLEPAKARIPA